MTQLLPLVASQLVVMTENGNIQPLQPLTASSLVQTALTGDLIALGRCVSRGERDPAAWLRATPQSDFDTLMSLRKIHLTLLEHGHEPPCRRILDYVLLLAVMRDDPVGRGVLRHCLARPGWQTNRDYQEDGPETDKAAAKQQLLTNLLTNAASHGRLDLLDYMIQLTGGGDGLLDRLGSRAHEVVVGATRNDHVNCLDYLLELAHEKEWMGEDQRSLLFEAVSARQQNAAHYLWAGGADVTTEYKNEQVLDVLVAHRPLDKDMARWLLDRGANPSGAGRGWLLPAEAALAEQDQAFLDMLIQYGLKINPVDTVPNAPVPLLVRGAAFGCHWAVPLLLKIGAQIDEPDGAGHSPLIAATLVGHIPTMRALLDAGANPLQEDGQRHTALWHAANDGKLDAFILLLEVSDQGFEATEAVATEGVAAWWRRRRLNQQLHDPPEEEETPRKL